MAKPELGTKRVCPTTGRKFYDLNKDPIISPYTGLVVPVAAVMATRGRPAEKPAPEETEEVATEEAEVKVVSLEDADEEETATGKKGAAPDGDEVDVDEEELPDSGDDDDTFLEEDEDEDVDAADLIDGDVTDDEES